MGRLRRTIHIDRKTESLWQKDDGWSVLGGTRGTWYIISCINLEKRLILNATNNN